MCCMKVSVRLGRLCQLIIIPLGEEKGGKKLLLLGRNTIWVDEQKSMIINDSSNFNMVNLMHVLGY